MDNLSSSYYTTIINNKKQLYFCQTGFRLLPIWISFLPKWFLHKNLAEYEVLKVLPN
jgi:hypothetical protein